MNYTVISQKSIRDTERSVEQFDNPYNAVDAARKLSPKNLVTIVRDRDDKTVWANTEGFVEPRKLTAEALARN